MNLEEVGYVIKRKWKRGSQPPVYEELTKVEVNKEIYKDLVFRFSLRDEIP